MKAGSVLSMRRACGALLGAAAIMAGAGVVAAADWPQFMGPAGDGTSVEKGLARVWPEGGPKVLWTTTMGPGYGGAAVRDGKVYVLDRLGQKQDVLRCLDLATGRELWSVGYDAPGEIDHDGSRSTPAVTEKYVYTIGPFGQFRCVDLATHAVVWEKDLLADFGAKRPRWAVAQSPVLYKDVVVAAPQGDRAGVVAFEPATGKVRWQSPPIGDMEYASPRLVTIGGVDQFVIVNRAGAVGVAAAGGKILWKYAHPFKIAIPNVSVLGDGKLFVTGGYNAGSAIVQVAFKDDAWTATEVARIAASAAGGPPPGKGAPKSDSKAKVVEAGASEKAADAGKFDGLGSQVHPGLVVKDHIYVICNTNERFDGLVCLNAKLEVVWQTKKAPFFDKGGSILTGDGLLYVMDGATGELYIIEPSPAGFTSLGKAKILKGEQIWAPLALVDGRLIVRDQAQMKCVDIRGQ
jgi:outer membrane protein assembly factor BamB